MEDYGGWCLSSCHSSVAEHLLQKLGGLGSILSNWRPFHFPLFCLMQKHPIYQLSHSQSFHLGALKLCIQAKSVTLLLVLKSPHLSFHPSQWPAHLLVQHSQLERTSKHANYVNCSIIFQPNFEPVYPLNARAEPFDFYIFCRAIHGLPVHIYIARVRLVKKNVLKCAATYRESRPATRSRKTVTTVEGILQPGYKVDL